MTGKPAAEALGLDVDRLVWRRPARTGPDHMVGDAAPGGIEVAMAARPEGGAWVLLRVAGDESGRVLVYDEHEWECFLDGVRNGEFDVSAR